MINDNVDRNREELEKHADQARSRLASKLETLDSRRRDIVHDFNPREMVRKHLPQMLLAGAAAVVSLVGTAVYGVIRARSRNAHMFRERWQALGRVWRHPERVVRDERPSFAMDIGRKIVGSLVGLVLGLVSRRVAASRELPAPSP